MIWSDTRSRYQVLRGDGTWLRQTAFSALWLALSFALSILANRYASSVAGASVGDIVLDHLPLWDVQTAHVYGASTFWLGILAFCLCHPKDLPFQLRTTAAFLLVRAAFVPMTHLGPPHNLLQIPGDMTSLYIYPGDLFFSGHVGGPFLFALLLRQHRGMHALCLLATCFFAAIVLLGHLHYSIDVFSAPFIAYGVYTWMARYSGVTS